jgi:DNA primase
MQPTNSFVDTVKDRIKLSDVAAKTLKLHKMGKHFTALCPFHKEKTPSFRIDDEKGFYYCFGCHAGGDVLDFMQKVHSLSFQDALKSLAESVGLQVPTKPQNEQQAQVAQAIYDINAQAQEWFMRNLESKDAKHARDYLQSRSITQDLIRKFSIGYAPNYSKLLEYFTLLGVSKAQLETAGLIKTCEDGKVIDVFRDRVMFPILSHKGNIVGFGGRALSSDVKAKYLNSPETPVFQKKYMLYAENFAFKQRQQELYIVEGYTDVIALHKVGITNVVATLGTAFSPEHLKRIWRVTSEPTICMDGDEAGVRAMVRAIDIALPLLVPGKSINFVRLPQGQDPDHVISISGVTGIKSLLANKISLGDALWNSKISMSDLGTLDKQAVFKRELMDQIKTIVDPDVQSTYKQYFSNKIYELFKPGAKRIAPQANRSTIQISSLVQMTKLSDLHRYELSLVSIIITVPTLMKDAEILQKLNGMHVKNNMAKTLLGYVLELSALDSDEFKKELENKVDTKTLDYLCGNNSYFLDRAELRDVHASHEVWNKTFAFYELELLRDEYRSLSSTADSQELQDKVSEMRAAIIGAEQRLQEIYDEE